MSRRTLAGLSLACAVALLPVASCTSGHPESEGSTKSTRSADASPETGAGTPSTGQPSAQKPPELDPDEVLAGRQRTISGDASMEFRAGHKGQALIVAVRCQGGGKMKAEVPSVHVSFQLECAANEVSTTYNQVMVPGVERSGTVSVTAPTAVHWSLTVGRGEPVQQESPDTDADAA
jgi:hypothetical protein